MNTQYRHSQPGYLMIIVGVVLIAIAAFVYAYGPQPPAIFLGAVGFFILVSGYKLTVEIKDCVLKFWFGPGIFWKNVPLERIAYCEPFKGIIFGWGIHVGPGGWLYNVSGMKAVTVVLKSGKKIHIGTDEPYQLIEAINSVLRGQAGDESVQMWCEAKADYLKRVERALSAARHPRSFEILGEVSNHLDRRFVELEPQQRTWENFQKITTEMGPPSEYAELIGQQPVSDKVILSAGYVIALVLILAAVGVGMIILPKALKPGKVSPAQQAFVNDPELVGKWVSVDLVKEPNEFNPDKKQWQGDFWLKDAKFSPDGTTSLGWISWEKGRIIENTSEMSAEYKINNINGTKYLFLPWLSGDVTIRHQKPEYYILKKVSETVSQQQAGYEQKNAVAIEAAKSWLKLVDDGEYSQSWAQAAGYFRDNVSESQWTTAMFGVRKLLGKAISREVLSSTYTKTVPGAPDGQYVIIQFKTSFENKAESVETVTPMMEPNGQWQVSGYYIK